MENQQNSSDKNLTRSAFKNIQSIMAIAYLAMVGIGMLFNHFKYQKFGINIFDYADVFDFLIAPFADLDILLFSIVSIGFITILFKIDNIGYNKKSRLYSIVNLGLDKKKWFDSFRTTLYVTLSLLYLFLAADYYGKTKYQSISEQEPIFVAHNDKTHTKGQYIGKTKDIIFLLVDNRTMAIPINNQVKFIDLKAIK